MSIFGKLKSAATKIKSSVFSPQTKVSASLFKPSQPQMKKVSVFGSTGKSSAFANAYSSLNNSSVAPTSTSSTTSGGQTIAPNMSTPQGIGRSNPDGSITLLSPTGQPTGTISGSSPIYSAPTTLRGGQTSTSTMSLAPTSEDTVITSESMGGSSSSSSEGGSMSSSPSISMPSYPTYADVGQINNGGLIASLADSYTYDPEKNMFSPVATTGQPQNTEVDKRTKLQDMLQKLIPKKDSLYEDPLIRQQNEEINRRKQEVNNYTSQLNSVVAQQNADLLRLRGIGSQEGVTETVYGGQAATINREAAIKALPIQAQLSAAQGNLQLAQDYLTQLTTWKKEEIDNEYNYKTALYSSIKDFVKGEEKIRLDELTKNNDREWDMKMKNLAIQADLLGKAMTSNPALIGKISAVNPASPTFMSEIGKVAEGLATASTTEGGDAPLYNGLKTATATAVRGIVTKFSSEKAIINFQTIQEGKNFVNSLSNKTKNPADDQALIYALAKALDPDSVVREGEYATAQKYAQSWVKAYGKSITQAVNGTGFLSEEARRNIKSVINTKYDSAKKSYDNVYSKTVTQINNLTGRKDGDKFLKDYSIEEEAPATAPKPYTVFTPKGQIDLSIFEK